MLPAKVLIIDDSEIVRTCVSDLLTERGVEVFELPSAIGASVVLTRNSIHTVIVDVSMPGLSGDRLIKLFRSNPRLRGISIVILTGKNAQERQVLKEVTEADVVMSKGDIQRLPIILGTLEADRKLPKSMRPPPPLLSPTLGR